MKITREKPAPRYLHPGEGVRRIYIRHAIYMQKLFRSKRLNQRTELGMREFMARDTWM